MIVSLIVSLALAAAVDGATSTETPAAPEAAQPAVEAAPTAEAAPAAEAKPADRDAEIVCRKPAQTASRAPVKKVCMTRAQWRAEDRGGGVTVRK